MIAGHFGFAAIVKSREPLVPLWSPMLATAWLDIVFIPMFVMKIETFEPVPGFMVGMWKTSSTPITRTPLLVPLYFP